jgi:hypothetical protein
MRSLFTFRRIGLAVTGLLILWTVCSCTDAQIARAEQAVEVSGEKLELALHAVDLAEEGVAKAAALAEQLGSEKGAELVAKAKAGLAKAREAAEIARQAHAVAQQSAEAARAAHDTGQGTIGVLASALGVLVPGLAGTAFTLWNRARKWKTATAESARLADKLKAAVSADSISDLDVGEALRDAGVSQSAAGVRDMIRSVRRS